MGRNSPAPWDRVTGTRSYQLSYLGLYGRCYPRRRSARPSACSLVPGAGYSCSNVAWCGLIGLKSRMQLRNQLSDAHCGAQTVTQGGRAKIIACLLSSTQKAMRPTPSFDIAVKGGRSMLRTFGPDGSRVPYASLPTTVSAFPVSTAVRGSKGTEVRCRRRKHQCEAKLNPLSAMVGSSARSLH